jgi:hypothetical protein
MALKSMITSHPISRTLVDASLFTSGSIYRHPRYWNEVVISRTTHNFHDDAWPTILQRRVNPYIGSLLDDCSLAFKVLVYGLFRPNPILHEAAFMQLSAYLWDWTAYLNLRYKTCNITWRSWNVPLHHIMCPTHGHNHLNLHKPTTHVSVLQLSLAFQGSLHSLSRSLTRLNPHVTINWSSGLVATAFPCLQGVLQMPN